MNSNTSWNELFISSSEKQKNETFYTRLYP